MSQNNGLLWSHLKQNVWIQCRSVGTICCCCCCCISLVVSNSVRPHRPQPTRLPRPWDSPGKNTGVGCHFLLQCMKVKSESEVAQSCPTLSDPVDCNPPGSSMGFSRQQYWSGVPLPSPGHDMIYDIMLSEEKNRQNRWTTNSNMMNFNLTISVITLNAKGLNSMIESKDDQARQ